MADDKPRRRTGGRAGRIAEKARTVPIMERAAGIVTNSGGRTCHAAIVSREMGTPAVVGTGDATESLRPGQEITLCCAEGEVGYVYDGFLDYEETEVDLDVPETETDMMLTACMRWVFPSPTPPYNSRHLEDLPTLSQTWSAAALANAFELPLTKLLNVNSLFRSNSG